MENVIDTLSRLKIKATSKISPTVNDYKQFERNVKNKYLEWLYDGIIDTIRRHKSSVGSMVYQFQKKRITISNKLVIDDILNKTEKEPVLYTQEMFDEFLVKYIQLRIENTTKSIVGKALLQGDLISNFYHLAKVEAEQEFLLELLELKEIETLNQKK